MHDQINTTEAGNQEHDLFAQWLAKRRAELGRDLNLVGHVPTIEIKATATSAQQGNAKDDSASQALSPLDIAKDYLSRGWNPIPIAYKAKKPLNDEWQNQVVTKANIATYFNSALLNVGVQLGPKSDDLTDVDLDCEEAIRFAYYFLPKVPTAVFGRHSKPKSHVLYQINDAPDKANLKLTDRVGKGGKCIVELRMGGGKRGAQTVFPGSTHESGEEIEWAHDCTPARSDYATLKLAVNKIAVATILQRSWPAGSGHAAALALGGFLARCEWTPDDIEKFVWAFVPDRNWVDDSCRTARDSAEAFAKGEKVHGFPGLRDIIGEAPAKAIAKILEYGIKVDDALLLDRADPMRSARALLASVYTNADNVRTLHRHRGAFWQWTGSYYRLMNDETIRAQIWTFLEKAFRREKDDDSWQAVPFKPIAANVSNVLDALEAITQLDEYIESPTWLSPTSLPPAIEFLACGNGLLHLPSGVIYPPTPQYFNVYASEVIFDPNATAPKWNSFLKEVFNNDIEAIELQQDWCGYSLSPDTSQQKILLTVGPKRSGKGTIARLLASTAGRDSVGGPTMSSLAQQFGLETLITKPLAIISDARIGARTDKSAIVERLLSISGEDRMSVPRKFNKDWTGKLPTRLMILTNELPSLSDGSGALAGRLLILVMTISFYGREDPLLTSKLMTELSGILNWMLVGYRRLRERGHFIQPKSSQDAVDKIEMLAAPVKGFIRDWCIVGLGLTVQVDDLWDQWRMWSEDEGRADPGTKEWFGRNLISAVPGLVVSRPLVHGKRERTYVGIRLRTPKDDADDAKADANATDVSAKADNEEAISRRFRGRF